MKNSLPALAFGVRSASIDNSQSDMQERIKLLVSGLQVYESYSKSENLLLRSSFLNVNGMKILAIASDHAHIKVGDNNDSTLIIPFSGKGEVIIDGDKIDFRAGVNGAILPACPWQGFFFGHSVLMIDINSELLELTAIKMLGEGLNSPIKIDLQRPKSLSLHMGRLSFETIFMQLANLLDHFSLQPELLDKTGMDDKFYRTLVMMMLPERFINSEYSVPNRKYARRLLDRICDYILAHLNETITLSTLERVGNMSPRNLHYAFLKRYNTTPMRWVRAERLALAHNKLVNSSSGATVTNIAFACGFNKASAFTYYYNEHYGELPSVTLARALAR